MDDADKELGKDPRITGYYVSEQIALLIFARIVEDLVYRLLFTAPIVGAYITVLSPPHRICDSR